MFCTLKGPLPDTFGDFWRMIWEQQCSTIVMMTKLEERNRVRIDDAHIKEINMRQILSQTFKVTHTVTGIFLRRKTCS